jgi:phospholipid/cholesterol/gamma-HCH transport system substrate-binding protein
MRKESGNKIRLGVFVTVTIVLFIAGIYFIGEKQQMFNETFHVTAVFKDINGLQVGNNVRFSGINVGIVDDIQQISDTTVRISMLINKETKQFMKKNAKAIIGSDGLMGNKIVSIMPGEASKEGIADNDMLGTMRAVSIDDILVKIKATSDNAANITGNLDSIIASIKNGDGAIGKFLMDTSFADNLDQTLVNIKQGTGGFKQNMEAAKHNILFRGFFKKKNNKDKDRREDKKEDKKEKKKEDDKRGIKGWFGRR